MARSSWSRARAAGDAPPHIQAAEEEVPPWPGGDVERQLLGW